LYLFSKWPPLGGKMSSPGRHDGPAKFSSQFRDLIKQKEAEIQNLNEQRFEDMEAALAEKDEEIETLRGKLARIQDDFQYNLQLVRERDEELNRMEHNLADTREKLEQSKQAHETESKQSQEQLATMKAQYEEFRDDLRGQLAQQVADAAAKSKAATELHEGLRSTVTAIEGQLGSARRDAEVLDSERRKLEAEKEEMSGKWMAAEQQVIKLKLMVEQAETNQLRSAEAKREAEERCEKARKQFHEDLQRSVENLSQEAASKEKLLTSDFQHQLAELTREHKQQVAVYDAQLKTLTADCDRRVAAAQATKDEEVATEVKKVLEEKAQREQEMIAEREKREHEYTTERKRLQCMLDEERAQGASRLQDLKHRLEALEAHDIPDLKQENTRLTMEVSNLQIQLDTARREADQRRSEIGQLQKQKRAELAEQETKSEGEMSKLRSQVTSLTTQLEVAKQTHAAQQAMYAQHQQASHQLGQYMGGQFGHFQHPQLADGTTAGSLGSTGLRDTVLLPASRGLGGGFEHSGDTAKVRQLSLENDTLRRSLQEVRSEMEQFQYRRQDGGASNEVIRLTGILEEKNNRVSDLEAEKARLSAQLHDAERSLDDLRREAREKGRNAEAHAQEVTRLREEVHHLQRENHSLKVQSHHAHDPPERQRFRDISNEVREGYGRDSREVYPKSRSAVTFEPERDHRDYEPRGGGYREQTSILSRARSVDRLRSPSLRRGNENSRSDLHSSVRGFGDVSVVGSSELEPSIAPSHYYSESAARDRVRSAQRAATGRGDSYSRDEIYATDSGSAASKLRSIQQRRQDMIDRRRKLLADVGSIF